MFHANTLYRPMLNAPRPTVILMVTLCLYTFLPTTLLADIFSDIWTTGVSQPNSGAFGTTASISGNALAAKIGTANVNLSANNGNWFKTNDATPQSNDELAPFLENDSPFSELRFSSDTPLGAVDVLVHNVWNETDAAAPSGLRTNYIGNFKVTYANGTVVENALPTIRAINVDSPFTTDIENGSVQPEGLNDAFNGGNLLAVSGPAFDPGNGAELAYYWSDPSPSLTSENQGFGIFSFDESNGGITQIEFTWVGNTVGTNTAFIGFAGQVLAVPEPCSSTLICLASLSYCAVRRRRAYRD